MGVQKINLIIGILLISIIPFQKSFAISSPNGKINIETTEGGIVVSYLGQQVLTYECGNLSKMINIGQKEISYEMKTGKRRICRNAYTEVDILLTNGGKITTRIFNDGIAWNSDESSLVKINNAKHNWIQKWVQPYEEFYLLDRCVDVGERWAFPALFEFSEGVFMLLTESNIRKDCAASSMFSTSSPNVFEICSEGSGQNGWVTAIVGKLKEVIESTLVTDNSDNCLIQDTSWIIPGTSSWVYWAYNHGSKDYDIVKNYIDMAIELKLPYVLIDAEWDEMNGEHTIVELLNYANSNGVKPMLWYNSSIGWIDGAPGPKFRLNDPLKREQEFKWCEENGVKGVKIDFFSGDNNQNIKYMIELLESASSHNLLVNFHGATLPRGWQRTYPNLISTEGVYGAEWYNNVPTFTEAAARHNATLPFTRNVVGSMDYTPCAFSDSQHPHITSKGHELALTALYESGIQHIADSPESIFAQPQEIQSFLSDLPTTWDNTYFLGGYPGDYVVLGREKNGIFYIAGINGNDHERIINFDKDILPIDTNAIKATIYTDSDNLEWEIKQISSLPETLTLKPRGGFVIKIK